MLRVSGLAVVSLLIAAAAAAADVADSANLFFIKRSKNTNEVHYDARVENCAWSDPEIDSYWRELEDGPNVYEELLLFEGPAYGFDVNRSSDHEITIRLRAIPERAITARLSRTAGGGCSVSATIEIDGETAQFRSVYVYAEENWIGWPTVHYIDVLGYSEDGQRVFERLPQTDLGREFGSPPDASLWQSGAISLGRR